VAAAAARASRRTASVARATSAPYGGTGTRSSASATNAAVVTASTADWVGPAPEQRHPLRQRQQQADGAQHRPTGWVRAGPVRRPSTSTTVTIPAMTRSRRCQDGAGAA
jgi:hypothetical protein